MESQTKVRSYVLAVLGHCTSAAALHLQLCMSTAPKLVQLLVAAAEMLGDWHMSQGASRAQGMSMMLLL